MLKIEHGSPSVQLASGTKTFWRWYFSRISRDDIHWKCKPLTYSKKISPLFCQREIWGKLQLLINLTKINHLIRHDYESHNFSIPTLGDAGNHLPGKKLSANLDCRQVYNCITMADEHLPRFLAFSSGDRNIAFSRLAEGLSWAPTVFCSFARQHLGPCFAEDFCTLLLVEKCQQLGKLDQLFLCINKCG